MKFRYLAPIAAASLALLSGCDNNDNDAPAPPPPAPTTPSSISLDFLGRYEAGSFATSAAEIPAFDAGSERIFVVNAENGVADVLDASDPTAPTFIDAIDANAIAAGAQVNSVATANGIVAIAIEAAVKTDPGFVAFYNAADLSFISSVQVGALPDNLAFTPDGRRLLVANEGEPNDDYSVDPEGSISIIDLSTPATPTVVTADFSAFDGQEDALRARGVRIFGPDRATGGTASASRDFEPEYITVSGDGTLAFAALQENNAFARIDIATATVTDILPLGYKDHGVISNPYGSSNALDVSDGDGDGFIDIRTWPGLRGMYHPDAIAAYDVGGETFIVTANEGDARAWGEDNEDYFAGNPNLGFVEEFRVRQLINPAGWAGRLADDLPPQLSVLAAGPGAAATGAGGALLNPDVFRYCGASAGDPGACRDQDFLGRLIVTWTMGYRTDAGGNPVRFNADGDVDPAGDRLMYDELYTFGGRSMSIFDSEGQLVWDSGDMIEQYFASPACQAGAARNIRCADFFNSNHEEGNGLDNRSDNKGPEPEGIVLGTIGDKTFAFLGLERMGGVMVFDITNPRAPFFVDYYNTREDWTTEDAGSVLATAGDLGPEGLVFVPATDSPNGEPLLIVGNEVSGTTAIFRINLNFD